MKQKVIEKKMIEMKIIITKKKTKRVKIEF